MNLSPATLLTFTLPVWFPALTLAQSGHWEGAIQVPNKELAVQVDLAKDEKGGWFGTIDIPPQNLKGFPLSNVTVKGNSVGFAMKGVPGDPDFDGKLSADSQSITGIFSQGGASLSFALKRTGDAKIEAPAKSTAISKELEGSWEGVLSVNGQELHLILKMANQPDGTAAGNIVSVDQGGAEIPITSITQKDSNLKLEVKSIAATYNGDFKAGALAGEWTQGGGTLPLNFKRQGTAEKK